MDFSPGTVVVVLLSVPIVLVSWRSLVHPRSHGFARFFAFEAILALLVLNAPAWFVRPLGPRQAAAWVLLAVSLVCLIWGLVLLRRVGGFDPKAELEASFEWERTGTVVDRGIFRFIRHPMYASLLYLAWGAYLKDPTAGALALVAAATVALFFTARAEEAENLTRFGDAYGAYMAGTKRFIPFVL
jgi:protein-S-isoprenylcysteine O-methyltransferase Ste14